MTKDELLDRLTATHQDALNKVYGLIPSWCSKEFNDGREDTLQEVIQWAEELDDEATIIRRFVAECESKARSALHTPPSQPWEEVCRELGMPDD